MRVCVSMCVCTCVRVHVCVCACTCTCKSANITYLYGDCGILLWSSGATAKNRVCVSMLSLWLTVTNGNPICFVHASIISRTVKLLLLAVELSSACVVVVMDVRG